MNLDEAIQLINWLDEEHRKDKAQISELSGQLSQHYTHIASLNKNLQDLEERLTRLQGQMLRFSQVEQAVGQAKGEVQVMIEQYEKRHLQTEEEQFKVRQLEREREDQVHSALQMQIEAMQQWQRGIVGDHDVLGRLDLVLVTLQRELEESIRRDEAIEQRMNVVEEWVPRFGQLATEQRQLAERLRQERTEAAEAARRAEQQRARHMAEWAEQMKASRRDVDEWIGQLRVLKEQNKEDRRFLPELTELEERLKPLEPRLMQWQRLVEETRHKEREQLVADMEKRWQQQVSEWQFVREDLAKRSAVLSERITKQEEWRPEVVNVLHDVVERIDKEHRERATLIVEVVRTLAEVEHSRVTNSYAKAIDDLLMHLEGEKTSARTRRPQPARDGG